jgi:putative CocE/NonD family hydrolase
MYEVKKEAVSMHARDGVRLDADIYRPHSEEKFPVLLMRQPYGRAIASTVVYAHPRWYASQGYIVIVQDVRGRGTSQGEFELFSHEIEDGYDTLTWVSQLEGSNGEVGMYGFSYQGMTQLYAAASHHRALKTICPGMIAYDLYTDWAYENGAFCLELNLAWAVQLAAETARLKRDYNAYKILYTASRNLPLYDYPSIFKEILGKYAPGNFYYQWLNHSENDEYWQQLSPHTYLKDVDLPMLHIGGWFDPYLRGTLNLYQEMQQRSQFFQYLIIGPWAHLPWGNKLANRDYGPAANSPVDEIQIAWFNKFLKGIDSEIFNNSPVYLFEMGSNQWRFYDLFPCQNKKIYVLNSTGLASIRTDNGKLVTKEEKILPSQDILVHDPWRPVPSLGGHGAIRAGSFERSELDNRSDILTYTSEFLGEDLHIAGGVEVEIYCSAELPTFDLCSVVSEVFPDGRVYNFTQGYIRVKPQQTATPVNFSLQPTCIKIPQGNAIRLSLSAACFPAYSVNCGSKDLGTDNLVMEAQIITLLVNLEARLKSQLFLSILVSDE